MCQIRLWMPMWVSSCVNTTRDNPGCFHGCQRSNNINGHDDRFILWGRQRGGPPAGSRSLGGTGAELQLLRHTDAGARLILSSYILLTSTPLFPSFLSSLLSCDTAKSFIYDEMHEMHLRAGSLNARVMARRENGWEKGKRKATVCSHGALNVACQTEQINGSGELRWKRSITQSAGSPQALTQFVYSI